MAMKDTILTGLRTNGEYHLGNYIGALKPMINFVHSKSVDHQINIFAPDLHSFTTPIEFGVPFYDQTMANLRLFVAAGIPIDNPNVFLYRQSFVPAHSEMTWILGNFTGFGEMGRMVEFKEKAQKLDDQRVSVGLFSYPILQAADILLYGARWVPVGDDQRQHLEFARDIAQRVNNQFGDIFVVPETIAKQQDFVGREEAPRIMSLRNPNKKMSKSVDDPSGTIMLSDTQEAATKKVMSAETDSLASINYDPVNQPGISNLIRILAALTDRPITEVASDWTGNERYGDLKKAVAEEVCKVLSDIQSNLDGVNDAALINHLESSEATMRTAADKTLLTMQRAVGLRAHP